MIPQIEIGACSDQGRQRDYQEDAYTHPTLPLSEAEIQRGTLLVVADGVGGHEAGEVASRTAVEIVERIFQEQWTPDVRFTLSQAITRANIEINNRALALGKENMATTIVCCVIKDAELTVAHIGDSRAYMLRGDTFHHLTNDHSWVQEQIELGTLTEAMASNHSRRHILTRSLGLQSSTRPDINTFLLENGDRVMLCTDGLYDLVSEKDIVKTLRYDPQTACERLVGLANDAGGTDNITALMAEIKLPPNLVFSPSKPGELIKVEHDQVIRPQKQFFGVEEEDEEATGSHKALSADDDLFTDLEGLERLEAEETEPAYGKWYSTKTIRKSVTKEIPVSFLESQVGIADSTAVPVQGQSLTSEQLIRIHGELQEVRFSVNKLENQIHELYGEVRRLAGDLVTLKVASGNQSGTVAQPAKPPINKIKTHVASGVIDPVERKTEMKFESFKLAANRHLSFGAVSIMDLRTVFGEQRLKRPWAVRLWITEETGTPFPQNITKILTNENTLTNRRLIGDPSNLGDMYGGELVPIKRKGQKIPIETDGCQMVIEVEEMRLGNVPAKDSVVTTFEYLKLRFSVATRT